jgi:hypothetical protein
MRAEEKNMEVGKIRPKELKRWKLERCWRIEKKEVEKDESWRQDDKRNNEMLKRWTYRREVKVNNWRLNKCLSI